MTRSFKRAGRAFAGALLLGGLLLTGVGAPVLAQQQPAASPAVAPTQTPEDVARATLRGETRIRRLRDRLEITAAEESLWAPVAQAMRENEAAFRADMVQQTTGKGASTAVDDLKMFQMIADHHSAGLKKLIPVFETFYEGLSPARRKRADRVFGERFRSGGM